MQDTFTAKKGKKLFWLDYLLWSGKHVFVSFVNKHNNYPLFEIQNRHATQHCKLPDELIEAKDTQKKWRKLEKQQGMHAQIQLYL